VDAADCEVEDGQGIYCKDDADEIENVVWVCVSTAEVIEQHHLLILFDLPPTCRLR
jgi:hypothetical protein